MSIDLEKLAALYEATTPGEWELGDGWIYTDPIYEDDDRLACVHKASTFTDLGRQIEEYRRVEANLALIVAARNALPELIERVREAESKYTDAYRDGNQILATSGQLQIRLDAAEASLERWKESAGENKAMREAAEARIAELEARLEARSETRELPRFGKTWLGEPK